MTTPEVCATSSIRKVPFFIPASFKDILIIGEYPSRDDFLSSRPFSSSSSGEELSRMLHEAGILQSECALALVADEIPQKGDIAHFFSKRTKASTIPTAQLSHWVKEIHELIRQLSPRVVIPLGELALWAVTGHSGIGKWRGSFLPLSPESICIPTYSPSLILREWSWRYIAVHDLRKAATCRSRGIPHPPNYEFLIRPSYLDACTWLDEQLSSRDPRRIAVDIETRDGHIACIGFATSTLKAICIPFMCVENPEGYWTLSEEVSLVQRICKLFSLPHIEWILQNGIYDLQYFARHWGHIPRVHMDTMLAHHVCFSGLPKGLDFLSSLYCKYHTYWKGESKDWDPALGEEQLWSYNCKDAVITFEVSQVLDRTIVAYGLSEPLAFQMLQFESVLRMMLRGVRQDLKRKGQFNLELLEAEARIQSSLDKIVGRPFNVRSSKQMQEFVYGELCLPVQRNRKTGNISCDDKALEKLASKEPLFRPIYSRISDLRSLGVFRSTFVQMRLDHDSRVRCSYNISGTETFRYSSSEDAFGYGGNLQNIPTGDEAAGLPNVRTLFLPDPGHVIFDCDLDRADAQVVAWESNDDILKQIFRSGEDLHLQNARDIFNNPRLTANSKERKLAKGGVHAINYGAKPPTLSRALGITMAEAERFYKRWFSLHPAIADWHRRVEDQLATTRSVENKFKFRRYYFDRVENLLPEALAWIPQSTVALVIDKGLVNVDRNLRGKVDVLLQVHDSLVMQCREDLFPSLKKEIRSNLLITIPYDDPLIIPVGLKSSDVSWGDCKDDSWD